MGTRFQSSVRGARVHSHEIIFHMTRGKHGDIFDAEGLENMLVEVVVERHLSDALDHCTGPIDSDLTIERENCKMRFIGQKADAVG